ncbi:hypothetical protein HG537_0B06290 [Torulaspora globosa]|uniref:FAD dependent oxidoreductase domain-containing protein n=1 Tax=Torulaspora globosa TaxID=48254 RepID=A0A7H9HPT4_9SACH|nr:hypothetical protein HG537_0B06290 [Torulaspora sp. CBS 2947]
MPDSVVIVGAGVIGLTIAHQLLLDIQCQSSGRLKKLTFISRNYPNDKPLTHEYTSPWAGAHFRPFPHRQETYESDRRESGYTRVTYRFFQQYAAEHPESTIEFMKGVDWLENPSSEYLGLGPGLSKDSLTDLRTLSKRELPSGVHYGCEYLTWCLNAPVYLKFLQSQVEQLCLRLNIPLQFSRVNLTSLQDIEKWFGDTNVIFNATGTGLQYSGGYDPKSFNIRGQTLLLNVPEPNSIRYANTTITHQGNDGLWTFVIKRPAVNGNPQYILGGTKQLDDDLIVPREADTQALLSRGRKLFPDLVFPDGSFDIVRVNVGFRPARQGGSRIELETSPNNGLKVVHAYGFGGMGYEVSVGAAQHAIRLYKSKPSRL